MSQMPALSIRQPWASLIINRYKPIENRSWPTKYRGWVLIHAGKTVDKDAARDVALGIHPVTGQPCEFAGMDFPTGGIIGRAYLTNCVEVSNNPWFVGPYGFVFENPEHLPFQPCRGLLGFFKPGADWTPPDYLDGRGPLKDEERLL